MRSTFFAAKCLLLVFSVAVFAHHSYAQIQSVTASTGAYFQGQNVAVSFTLGEPIINTLENPELKITQGFHQPNLVVTTVNEIEFMAFDIEVYPNPVTSYLNLVCSDMLPAETSYALYNSYGGLILEKKLNDLNTNISFQNLVSAVYILKVSQGTTTLKTFKVIKK